MKTLKSIHSTTESAQSEIDRISSESGYPSNGTERYANPITDVDDTGNAILPPYEVTINHRVQKDGLVDETPCVAPEILLEFDVSRTELQAKDSDADGNIMKLSGNIKNYVANLTDGVRTSATDVQVQELINDNNIIITVDE